MASVWVGNGVDMLLERALTHATGEKPDAALHAKCRQLFDDFMQRRLKPAVRHFRMWQKPYR